MARLQQLPYKFYDLSLSDAGTLVYTAANKLPIAALPQIFWQSGESWSEANQFALNQAASTKVKIATVERKMKHIHYYACFLEEIGQDWRQFPVRTEDKILVKFRKHLVDAIETGLLESSTGSNCINAVVEFYRFAQNHNLINPKNKMWNERLVTIPLYDSIGFRSLFKLRSTDLRISNKSRHGARLEEGLLPLSASHTTELLQYTARYSTYELHLMLSTGFLTGARNGTVGTLTVASLYTASPDLDTKGIYRLPVGPGTKVRTKNSVVGSLWIPEALLKDLKEYATSTRRLLREAKAAPQHKKLLFLTRSGKPYEVKILDRLINDLRENCCSIGMGFMRTFKFHQSRATFGTWLTQLLLSAGLDTVTAIREVKSAMLHKDESVTWKYIKFLEVSKAKIAAATKFNELFTGISNRDWSQKSV